MTRQRGLSIKGIDTRTLLVSGESQSLYDAFVQPKTVFTTYQYYIEYWLRTLGHVGGFLPISFHRFGYVHAKKVKDEKGAIVQVVWPEAIHVSLRDVAGFVHVGKSSAHRLIHATDSPLRYFVSPLDREPDQPRYVMGQDNRPRPVTGHYKFNDFIPLVPAHKLALQTWLREAMGRDRTPQGLRHALELALRVDMKVLLGDEALVADLSLAAPPLGVTEIVRELLAECPGIPGEEETLELNQLADALYHRYCPAFGAGKIMLPQYLLRFIPYLGHGPAWLIIYIWGLCGTYRSASATTTPWINGGRRRLAQITGVTPDTISEWLGLAANGVRMDSFLKLSERVKGRRFDDPKGMRTPLPDGQRDPQREDWKFEINRVIPLTPSDYANYAAQLISQSAAPPEVPHKTQPSNGNHDGSEEVDPPDRTTKDMVNPPDGTTGQGDNRLDGTTPGNFAAGVNPPGGTMGLEVSPLEGTTAGGSTRSAEQVHPMGGTVTLGVPASRDNRHPKSPAKQGVSGGVEEAERQTFYDDPLSNNSIQEQPVFTYEVSPHPPQSAGVLGAPEEDEEDAPSNELVWGGVDLLRDVWDAQRLAKKGPDGRERQKELAALFNQGYPIEVYIAHVLVALTEKRLKYFCNEAVLRLSNDSDGVACEALLPLVRLGPRAVALFLKSWVSDECEVEHETVRAAAQNYRRMLTHWLDTWEARKDGLDPLRGRIDEAIRRLDLERVWNAVMAERQVIIDRENAEWEREHAAEQAQLEAGAAESQARQGKSDLPNEPVFVQVSITAQQAWDEAVQGNQPLVNRYETVPSKRRGAKTIRVPAAMPGRLIAFRDGESSGEFVLAVACLEDAEAWRPKQSILEHRLGEITHRPQRLVIELASDQEPDDSVHAIAGQWRVSLEEIWQAVLGHLELEMSKASFDTWARGTTLCAHENGTFIVSVNSSYAKDWLENRLKHTIARTLGRVVRQPTTEVRFVIGQL